MKMDKIEKTVVAEFQKMDMEYNKKIIEIEKLKQNNIEKINQTFEKWLLDKKNNFIQNDCIYLLKSIKKFWKNHLLQH